MPYAWLFDAISVPPLVKFVFRRGRPPSAANLRLSLYHRIFFKKMQFLPKRCTISSCCRFGCKTPALPGLERDAGGILVRKNSIHRVFYWFLCIWEVGARKPGGVQRAASFCRITKNAGGICVLCTSFKEGETGGRICLQKVHFYTGFTAERDTKNTSGALPKVLDIYIIAEGGR